MAEESKKYIETVGRRKTSVARVRLTEASKMSYVINDREFTNYFPTAELQRVVTEPFVKFKMPGKFKITIHTNGGGISSQSVACRLGISRALLEVDKELRTKLKKEGFLKRDPRAKERRKFGLKKARKAPQWSKR